MKMKISCRTLEEYIFLKKKLTSTLLTCYQFFKVRVLAPPVLKAANTIAAAYYRRK